MYTIFDLEDARVWFKAHPGWTALAVRPRRSGELGSGDDQTSQYVKSYAEAKAFLEE